MNFSENSVVGAKEILKRKLGGEYTVEMTIPANSFTNGVLKAGSPISSAGAVANTSSAVGIVLNDVYAERPIATVVKAFAVINTANANANAGITIADAVKTALPLIVFE